MDHFKVLSLSHKLAPVEVRESLHLLDQEAVLLLRQIREVLGIEEALALSTCNRTEIYYISEEERSADLARLLCITKGQPFGMELLNFFETETETRAAVEHLFSVSMGLDSKVTGDLQISNQVKNAYRVAAEEKMAGPFLHRLLHTIFHANKRVQQETPFRDGAASVSYAAAELASELTSHFPSPSVLVLGLGEMGRDVARNLVGSHFGRIVVCNRTRSKAEEIQLETGAEIMEFDDFRNHLSEFQVVISSLAAQKPLLNREDFAGEGIQNKFLIDLSVPRSIAADLEKVPGILVFNVDEITAKTNEVLNRRMAAIPDVRAIIQTEIANFSDWSREAAVSPTIHALKEALEQIRRDEVARFLKKATPGEADLLEKATKSMVNKILRLPVLQLKAACKRGEEENLVEVLVDLFDLEKEKKRDLRS